jgi:large subunit ribosomal protein L31
MKKSIHPKYGPCKITCSCGNVIETRSTRPELRIEICSNCHPYYTGKERSVDTTGRVEKFRRRYGLSEPKKEE